MPGIEKAAFLHAIAAKIRAKQQSLARLMTLDAEEQALLVVEIAKSQNRLFGGTEGYLVTRELKQITDPAQRALILDCLFEVSAADGSISAVEENLVRQIASELGLSLQDYVAARAAWSDRREVLRRER